MIKKIIENIKSIEKNILKIMFLGFKFSFFVYILSAVVLLFYIINPVSHIIYESGLILFKTSLTFAVSFFICAFAIDKIKKQMI
ncbi:MAG: hypothetical protein Q4G09_01970 [Clostridia bacterium]|nr:hypothetical protein [Clostridia bacterium]